jgi:hypothetical protein
MVGNGEVIFSHGSRWPRVDSAASSQRNQYRENAALVPADGVVFAERLLTGAVIDGRGQSIRLATQT